MRQSVLGRCYGRAHGVGENSAPRFIGASAANVERFVAQIQAGGREMDGVERANRWSGTGRASPDVRATYIHTITLFCSDFKLLK